MKRTQFTFYESFFKAISHIRKKSDRADAYDAICSYALYGIEPDAGGISDAANIAFELSKPNLDASRRKAMNGKKGGICKQEENESKLEANESKPEANTKQEESESKKENKKEKEIENECYKEKGDTSVSPQKKKKIPPSLQEVETYCKERGNHIDAQRFIDFYTAKGWMIGKNRMTDWESAVRTWEQREEKGGREKKSGNVFARLVMEGKLSD